MALTNEDLEKVRLVVRSEMAQSRGGGRKVVLLVLGIFAAAFFAVLVLHVLVIGGFTLYHLLSSGGAN